MLPDEDLKKPLRVQFVGEEGIDEGGLQKEYFQVHVKQQWQYWQEVLLCGPALARGENRSKSNARTTPHSLPILYPTNAV